MRYHCLIAGQLQLVEDNYRRDFLALEKAQAIGRPRTIAERQQDERISHISGELASGRLQVFQFLEMASNLFEPDHSNVRNLSVLAKGL
jgi:hypothetical protein